MYYKSLTMTFILWVLVLSSLETIQGEKDLNELNITGIGLLPTAQRTKISTTSSQNKVSIATTATTTPYLLTSTHNNKLNNSNNERDNSSSDDDNPLCPPELSGCQCNLTSVVCVDTDFVNASFFLSVPKIVESVKVTYNNLTDLPANLFGGCDGGGGSGTRSRNTTGRKYSSMKYLDLSSNGIQEIHRKTFHCLPKLETLILRNNDWKMFDANHTGVFEALMSLRILDLDSALAKWSGSSRNRPSHLIRIPFILNKTSITLEDLNLSNNEIITLTDESADMLCSLQSLRRLNLSNNYLTEVRMNPSCTYNINQLDLSHNSITFLGSFLTLLNQSMPSTIELWLGHNKYMCNCFLIEFYEWLKVNKHHVKDVEHVICADSYKDKYRGLQLLSLAITDLKCEPEPTPNIRHLETSYFIMWFVFASISCSALIVAYLKRESIKQGFKRCVAPYSTPRALYSYASIEI